MDLSILLWIQTHMRSEILDQFFKIITMLGDNGIIWIILTLVLLLRKKTRYVGLVMACSLLLSVLIVNIGLKPLIGRPRPYEVHPLSLLIPPPSGSSFPSAHSASSFAAAWAYAIIKKDKLRYVLLALAAAIAFSRLYLFVHFPTDVISGICIGILCAILARILVDRLNQKWRFLANDSL